jgi:hypothetical protein
MPLKHGSNAKAVSSNIKELTKALAAHGGKGGKHESHAEAHKRAVAAAMRMKDDAMRGRK